MLRIGSPDDTRRAQEFPFLRPPKFSRSRRLMIYGIAAAVWLTGAVWVVLHYFFISEGPFGAAPHPLEFWSLVSHGAAAFAALWLFGLLWGVHVPIGWRLQRRRWSGGVMFGLAAWLILSGYLLYYVGNDQVMSVVAILHWSLGLAAPLLFLLHRFARERPRSKNAHTLVFDMSYERRDG
jgi:predicted MFS family arabinose efflux permease